MTSLTSRGLARSLWDALVLVALLWTVHGEQRHLGLYLAPGPHGTAGFREAIDVVATLILFGFAIYELFHMAGMTKRFDRFIAAHPALEPLSVVLLIALCWGIFRDATHFHHEYLVPDSDADEVFDLMAVAVLGLEALKLGYHGVVAVKTLGGLADKRR
jgi:hypothetical protein